VRPDRTGRGRESGFSLTELLVAAAITALVGSAVIGLAGPARAAFQAQPEIADMHQRVRAAVEALGRDLLIAGAGLDASIVPPVVPYRVGARDSDPLAGVFYRTDAITIRYVPWNGSAVVSRTYELEQDATNISRLVQYDGGSGEFAMVDHVVTLAFAYVGDGDVVLDPSTLQDGPWIGTGTARFDGDLLTVRRVSVRLRVEAALSWMRGAAGPLFARGGTSTSAERYAPDQQVTIDVALRNATPDR
jgi:prepilin-type N-terminal cleavage/methylation domain-containing protein